MRRERELILRVAFLFGNRLDNEMMIMWHPLSIRYNIPDHNKTDRIDTCRPVLFGRFTGYESGVSDPLCSTRTAVPFCTFRKKLKSDEDAVLSRRVSNAENVYVAKAVLSMKYGK